MSEPLDWSGGGPRSLRFDDIYFSKEDGLAEARAVFLEGCGLPHLWSGRERFVVGELGFGAGLNILALLELWSARRPAPRACLHIFSVDAFPMSKEDAARALLPWPALAELAAPLLAAWPRGRSGLHRIEWPALGAILDLAVQEAGPALEGWAGRADAWFLDGFSPAKNPDLWRQEVLGLVAARSRPGARAASFTVAGAVRRGLGAAGFAVERVKGFGSKKERLEARLSGAAAPQSKNGRIAVIGAGIAGAALVRAFDRLGASVTLLEGSGRGAGGSGNPAALVTPRLDAGLGLGAALHAQAFARAVALYRSETPEAVIAQGALQLAVQDKDLSRFDRILAWDGFDPGEFSRLDGVEVARRLERDQAPDALSLSRALVLEPETVLRRWAPEVRAAAVATLCPPSDARSGWALLDADGALVLEADVVCLAAGPASIRLAPGLPLRAVRGQVSLSSGVKPLGPAAVCGGYALPLRDGVLFGATHQRDDWSTELREEDARRNLLALAAVRPAWAEALCGSALGGRAALRAMAPDHMPLAGAVPGPGGLYLLSGLGGRGFTLAPLLAEAVAAQALGAPSPLTLGMIALTSPSRFGERPSAAGGSPHR